MQLENKNYKTKCITTLSKNDHKITEQTDILEECKTFYKQLYSETVVENNFENCNFFATKHEILDEIEKTLCEQEVTVVECHESLIEFPNNKCPGSDGLAVDFYKFFWDKIKSFLMDSYNYSFENNLLSLDQRRALLVLIPKGTKDKRELQNWRPISLLDVDYKILAKVLAKKLQQVITKIISPDQAGYIKGRYIGDNIRTMLDILDITKNKTEPGIMIMIDFEKAFDTISWSFLHKTLNFNFGPTFKKYIKLLYTSSVCSVTNNGFHSEFFNISRGIRQGCPISALLFILYVEVLAIYIREQENIKGIMIGKNEIRITQFADDTCLYLNGTNSLENVIAVFEDFYRYAGLRLNIEKTEAIWLGKTNRYGKICNIKITHKLIKVLGIWISKDFDEMLKINFDERIEKLNTLLNIWSQRNLTIKERITILKAKALPLVTYMSTCPYVPKLIIDTIDKVLYNFVWKKKHHVKRTALIASPSQGGLKMPASFILETNNIEIFLKYKNEIKYLHPVPKFYEQLLDIWYSIHNKEPLTVEEILQEDILVWVEMVSRILFVPKLIFLHFWDP